MTAQSLTCLTRSTSRR